MAPAGTAVVAAVEAIGAAAPAPSPSATAPLSAAAMESVKRRGLQLSSELQEFVSGFSRDGSHQIIIPLELKLLLGLILLFLFLLFLILVLWDRYGKEIGELYTPNLPSGVGGDANDVNPNDVADEYTVYQKLPTFFYEYMPKKRN